MNETVMRDACISSAEAFRVGSLLLLIVFASTLWVRAAQQSPSSPSETRDRGIQLYKQGDFKGSIKLLNQAIKKNKDDADAWYYLGLASVRDNDLRQARKAFEAAVRIRSDFGSAHTGFAYALMLTDKNFQAGREAARALELNTQDAEARYVLGVVRLRERRNDDAQKEAEAAIKLNPKFAPAYLLKSQTAVYQLGAGSISKVINATANRSAEDRKKAASRSRALLKEAAEALETYLKLSPNSEDFATWRDQLETLRVFSGDQSDVVPSDEVTIRARVLSKPEPTYTERARQAGVSGTVILRAVFSSDGTIKHVLVIRSLPYGLTEQAITASRKIKFIPAMKDSKPVSMIFQLEYNFSVH